jgi:hypothetical protein
MHVIVEGTLVVGSDGTLDVDGLLYIGPNGTLDARGGLDGADGHSLEVNCDGFTLIEGRLLSNGTDKLGTTELSPFSAGSGPGAGGSGGNLAIRSPAPGPIWVPTIVTRGGDANGADDAHLIDGGQGGAVAVRALAGSGDPAYVFCSGRRNDPAPDGHTVGLPDYLPPPGPFNQTVVISATPMASGTCPVNPTAPNASFLRPVANERLPLGRAVDGARMAAANVSRFRRGIISCGGLGGALTTATPDTAVAPSGGPGGGVTIQNDTPGRIRFLDAQVFTGAGPERLAYQFFVAGGGCADFKYFELATGGPGGMCRLSMGKGGTGGMGGRAGNIYITGAIFPALAPAALGAPAATAIIGYDSDNPNSSSGITIGSVLTFGAEQLSTSSAPGSGGSPGGSPASFPGWFGMRGPSGSTVINGVVLVALQ